MADLSVSITGFVAGDDLEIRRTVTDLPAPIQIAWLTIKHHTGQSDAEASLQKKVTPTDLPGTGYISEVGGPGLDGLVRFDLTHEDTRSLGSRKYGHDIQVRLTTGAVYTIEKGTIQFEADYTREVE
jgi:hypothetical protein